jgi:hypothetical protein
MGHGEDRIRAAGRRRVEGEAFGQRRLLTPPAQGDERGDPRVGAGLNTGPAEVTVAGRQGVHLSLTPQV